MIASALIAVPQPAANAADPSPLFLFKDPAIIESSGLAVSLAHPGLIWTHNDSGNPADVYAVDTRTGATLATITLRGVPNVDWEAIAMGRDEAGRPTLYVGELGTSLPFGGEAKVYRFVEPAVLTSQEVRVQTYTLRFPGPRPDAETLLVDPRDNRMYVVSKDPSLGVVYAAPAGALPGTVPLSAVGECSAMVSDGTFLPNGQVVLRTNGRAYVYSAPGGTRLASVALPATRTGESVATADGRALLVGSEGAGSAVYEVALPAAYVSTPSAAPAVTTVPSTSRPSAAPSPAEGSAVAPRRAVAQGGVSWRLPLLFGGALVVILMVGLFAGRRRLRHRH